MITKICSKSKFVKMKANHYIETCNMFLQQNLQRDRRERTDFQHCG